MTGRWCIVGGAGFIGSHFATRLLADPSVEAVTIYDNFSSGREWHLADIAGDERLTVVRADVKDLATLTEAMRGSGTVIHLASNPDIARAATEPDIDFWEGTFLTNQVVEGMRLSGARHLLYASGSGVYGELGAHEFRENHGPLVPVSTYGASKLASEALIASYCHMFDLRASVFRFGNVVGPRQTHGVGFDFVRKLREDPTRLTIFGNGLQSKSYVHVEDVMAAVLLAHDGSGRFKVFNVATGDYITVCEIADIAVAVLKLDPAGVVYEFTGGDRGWKGDVPVVRLNTDRIKALGWKCRRSSAEALRDSMVALSCDYADGRI